MALEPAMQGTKSLILTQAHSRGGSSQLGGSGPRSWLVGGLLLLPSEMSVIVGGSFQPSG